MTGSLGFGVGVAAGVQTLIAPVDVVSVRYWLSDVLVVVPSLAFRIFKPTTPGLMAPASDTQWNFTPSALILFVPFRSTTTRLEVGGGLGLDFSKMPPADTVVGIQIPLAAGVEHFFARWFSMGIAAQSNLFDYTRNDHFSSTSTPRPSSGRCSSIPTSAWAPPRTAPTPPRTGRGDRSYETSPRISLSTPAAVTAGPAPGPVITSGFSL